MMTIKLYSMQRSGHAHAARNMLALLEVDHEIVEVDARGGQTRSEEFSRLNPFQQIPVLDDDGFVLRDSHAILVYLALKFDAERRWLPEDPAAAATVQQWLATSTLDLVVGPAWARAAKQFGRPLDLEAAQKRAHRLLGRMDAHLADRSWLALEHPSIADVSMYPYVALAPEGGVDPADYGHVAAWVQRLEALPNFVVAPRL